MPKLGLTVALLAFPASTLAQEPLPRTYTIPIVDLAQETQRQVIVDREPGQYLGHPTTVLLEDGKTIIEFPVTGGVIGALIVPQLAALGAIAALATRCTISVERNK